MLLLLLFVSFWWQKASRRYLFSSSFPDVITGQMKEEVRRRQERGALDTTHKTGQYYIPQAVCESGGVLV